MQKIYLGYIFFLISTALFLFYPFYGVVTTLQEIISVTILFIAILVMFYAILFITTSKTNEYEKKTILGHLIRQDLKTYSIMCLVYGFIFSSYSYFLFISYRLLYITIPFTLLGIILWLLRFKK